MSDELKKVLKDNNQLEKLERSLRNGGNLKSHDTCTPKAPSSSSAKEVKKS